MKSPLHPFMPQHDFHEEYVNQAYTPIRLDHVRVTRHFPHLVEAGAESYQDEAVAAWDASAVGAHSALATSVAAHQDRERMASVHGSDWQSLGLRPTPARTQRHPVRYIH